MSGAKRKGKRMATKRSIFEEVGAEQKAPVPPAGGGIDARPKGARRGIRMWLVALFLLVVAMIVVGGLTRLTDSGLSITEWNLVTGIVPPMSTEDWLAEFAKYQASPEFMQQNSAMQLEEFKGIYWWEWGHRFLGRFVGLPSVEARLTVILGVMLVWITVLLVGRLLTERAGALLEKVLRRQTDDAVIAATADQRRDVALRHIQRDRRLNGRCWRGERGGSDGG